MNPQEQATATELSAQDSLFLWREMTRIRYFELTALQHYMMGRMGGWFNAQIGQEAIPVAMRSLMEPHDHSISSHRCLGHALASGMTMRNCMAELFGRATGSSKGKGGMHSFHSPETRFWGGYGVVATQTPLACGLGFALKHRGEAGAVLCCLGDGAANQGAFHEALNLAALFHLPVVFIIENNLYAMGTAVRRGSAFRGSLAQRAQGYGMAWATANGDDIADLRAKIHPALERARHEHLPTLLEAHTYRFEGHTIADANKFKYRSKAEVNDRTAHHDPIRLWGDGLMRDGIATADDLVSIRDEALHEAQDAAKFASASAYPTREAITQDVYWEVDHQSTAGRTGRHFFND